MSAEIIQQFRSIGEQTSQEAIQHYRSIGEQTSQQFKSVASELRAAPATSEEHAEIFQTPTPSEQELLRENEFLKSRIQIQ